MNLIHYLLEANLYMAAFWLLYVLLLRSETLYQLNRIYLLLTSVLAFVIPLLQLGILKPSAMPLISIDNIALVQMQGVVKVMPVAPAPVHQLSLVDWGLIVYGVITITLLIRFILKVFKLVALSKQGQQVRKNGFVLVEIPGDDAAFSFFGYLFINQNLATSATILCHEEVHIRQRHSWDIVYLELLKIVNWFNPVVYLLQKSVREVHEFIADEHAAVLENGASDYADFLISNAYGLPQTMLTNSFFNKNLLKRRITMLYQKKSGKAARLKYLLALPLFGGMICASTLAFTKDYGWIDIAPKRSFAGADTTQKSDAPLPGDTSAYAKGWRDAERDMKSGKLKPGLMTPHKYVKEPVNNNVTLSEIKPNSAKDTAKLAMVNTAIKTAIHQEITNEKDGQQQSDKVFTAVETNPDFPGGIDAFMEYLRKNVRYPKEAREKNVQGRVFIKFIVEKDGSLTDLKVLRDPGTGLGDEAMRVMAASPKWKPGIQNGKAVRVEYTVPINFALADDVVIRGTALELNKFMATHVRYATDARARNIQGRVFATFTVGDNQKVENIEILRSPDKLLSDEVVRILSTYRLTDGKANVSYVLPVNFLINIGNDSYETKATENAQPIANKAKVSYPQKVSLNEVVVVTYKSIENK